MRRLSLNINAQALGANPQRVIDFVCALQPAYVLILDDHKDGKWAVSRQIHGRSPQTKIIHRHYLARDPNNPAAGGWDASLPETPAGSSTLQPGDFVNFLSADNPGFPVYHQIMCEPAVYGDRLNLYLRWLITGMDIAASRNQRWCVYNAQSVAIRAEDINAGVYDAFLFALARHKDVHILGLHEYALGVMPANVSNAAIDMLTRPGALPFERWYKELIVPAEAHLGRYKLLLQRAKLIGASPFPDVIMTEFGVDDVRLGNRNEVAALNNGAPPMGAVTLSTYWHKQYPQWTRDECWYQQTKWAEDTFIDIAALCLYGIDSSFENGRYHLGDMTDWQMLTLANVPTPPVVNLPPVPTPTPAPKTLEERVADLERRVSLLEK